MGNCPKNEMSTSDQLTANKAFFTVEFSKMTLVPHKGVREWGFSLNLVTWSVFDGMSG